jgi:3-oxoacyl-[acyl-carrier protein] reductase
MLTIDLTGKVALVAGGLRGIGAGITEALCRAGAAVVFTHTGKPGSEKTVADLLARVSKEGGSVKAVVLDACDSAKTKELANKIVAEYGKIDILVFNVGRNIAKPAEEVPDEEWNRSLELNLSAAFYAVKAVLPYMIKAHYGRIILIGSSAVVDGGGGAVDYAAAKAGLTGMMLYLTKNYTRKGILTNIIHPCVIDTDLLRKRYSTDEARKKLAGQIPAGRLGTPEDIAGMVAYLASSRGDYIAGQSFLLDGGRTLFK